jgi:type I restriction enzyme S subunit
MRKDWTTAPYKDFLDYIQPTNYLVDSTDYHDSYETPVLTAGKTFTLGYTNEEHGIFEDTPVIIFDDFTTASKYVNFKFKAKSSAMKILKPTSTLVDLKFIYYSMQMNQINTDTHKRYWISIYAEHDLLVPPLLEQKAIVAKIEQLFSELDNGIENLKTAQAKLKIYRQAVLQKAFDGELTNIQTIKWIEIKDIVKNVEYGTSSKSLEMGTVPVLRMGNIQNGKFDWNDLKYSNDEEEISKYHLNLNDVLFNRTNSPEHVGKTAIFKSDKKAIFAGYLIRINYLKDKINGDYLTYYLNSHTAKQYGNKIKSFGVNQSNINGTKLKTYPFPLCSLVEQSKIVQEIESRLSVCDKIEETISNSLVKAEALRQSILKKAFEGNLLNAKELETIHAHPDYESAEELLKRIKQERVK